MEKVGTGIRRIRKFCLENNNAIDIKPGDTYFSVEMKSPKVVEITEQNVGDNVGENVGESSRVKLSKNQNLILQLLLEDKELSIEKMAESVGITTRSVAAHNWPVPKNVLKHSHAPLNGKYPIPLWEPFNSLKNGDRQAIGEAGYRCKKYNVVKFTTL